MHLIIHNIETVELFHVPSIHRVKSRTCKHFSLRKAEARAQSKQLVLYTLQEEKTHSIIYKC